MDLCGFGAVTAASGGNIADGLIFGGAVWFLSLSSLLALRAAGVRELKLVTVAIVLVSIGLLVQYRIDSGLARTQLIWLIVATIVSCGLSFLVKDHRSLARFKYLFGTVGIFLLIIPAIIGVEHGGAKLWLQIGPYTVQPSEIAKILLAVFFAGYLSDRQRQLSEGRDSILHLPHLADVGPLLMMWILSLVVLVVERDLGSSLLFFGLFITLMYAATRRPLYPVIGGLMFTSGAVASYFLFSHLRVRVDVWLDPWSDFFGRGYQIGQSLLAMASGGISGRGLGYGFPTLIPAAATDFPFAVIGEELGIIGTALLLLLYLMLITRGFHVALNTPDLFGKLLAAGLSSALALQVLVIIGGVTKAIPMTGVTLPFVSYGGSSLVANMILITLLARIGDPPVAKS